MQINHKQSASFGCSQRGIVMYCYKCGREIKDDAQFCDKCGTPTPSSGTAQVQGNYYADPGYGSQGYSRPAVEYAPGTHPYHSVGGGLAAVITLFILGGLTMLILIIPTFIDYLDLLKGKKYFESGFTSCLYFSMIGRVVLFFTSSCCLFSFESGIRKQKDSFLHNIQSSSIAMMVLYIIYYLIVIFWTDKYVDAEIAELLDEPLINTNVLIGTLLGIVIGWCIILGLLSAYFSTSVRVRTFMGSDEYLRQSVFNKNTIAPAPADGSDRMAQNDTLETWTCIKCGEVNTGIKDYCIVCHTSKDESIKKKYFTQSGRTGGKPSSQRNPKEVDPMKEWQCPNCGRINANYVGTCGCGQVRPELPRALRPTPKQQEEAAPTESHEAWTCPKCGEVNPGKLNVCPMCRTKKE